MTLHIELDEDSGIVHILVDDHLNLVAEKRTPSLIVYKNFDSLVDDPTYLTVKSIASSLLSLSDS